MPHSQKNRAAGFSLIELGIVLIIVTLLSAGAITALRIQTERNRLLETRTQLGEAREALINYAASNLAGVLPCPDTNDDGKPDACDGNSVHRGRLPWHLLGLPRTDPWGQALHYAVHQNFIQTADLRLSTQSGLEIESLDNANNYITLADEKNVVLAIWSGGADATSNPSGSTINKVLAEAPDADDIVIWLSRFVLLGRMLEAGREIPQ